MSKLVPVLVQIVHRGHKATSGTNTNPISIEGDNNEEDKSGLPEKEKKRWEWKWKFDCNKGQWTAPVYQFFHPPILKFDKGDKDRLYTWFVCNSKHCKASTGANGIYRYMDKPDTTTTKNLKCHATKCFSEASV
ncbi:hypothetical protein DFH08DRAFT_946645 [Mycena albidolilacea]|uniref:Uncharacterized protein n=1 Tax=Mycena albidolilacea TaxID=1033008 RepID=A0AAD7ATN2_9AGAR|nr:hypothetical protein DFH08DRAFT_946645 [Mycena albidolilacea]